MERKIGEIFEFGGEWYQCVKSDGTCNGCVGKFQSYSLCNEFDECVGKIFKKLEKVGEPYEFDGHLFQSYRTFEVPIFTENYATVRELGNNSKISIEIKQNKEDMEDLDKIKARDYTKVEELNVMEENKLNLKPFDIQKAREGKPVCTRDGRKARIICFDAKGDMCPIIALVEENGIESAYHYDKYGRNAYKKSGLDLMMLPDKKERWINVYKELCYESKEEAIRHIAPGTHYIDTIRVEWEDKE